jgi:hypothetical protein
VLSRLKGTPYTHYFFLRYTSPLSAWRALDLNPLSFLQCAA